MKYIAIGDIHGQFDMLNSLYNDIKKIDAKLVFLGDYIDRGDKSKEVVDLLLEIKKEKPDTIILKGNHEEFLKVTFFTDDQIAQNWFYKVWINNGGLSTLASYDFPSVQVKQVLEAVNDCIPKEHIDFYNNLPVTFETDKLFFVHAGVDLNKSFHLNDENDFLWIRPPFGHNDKNFPKKIIHGHTPNLGGIVVMKNRICVDTAAYRGGKLTGVMIDESGELLDIFEVL